MTTVRADAVGSGELLGMDLVRALIGLTRSLGWESLIPGEKEAPEMTLHLVEADRGKGAWILFDASLVPELTLARGLTNNIGNALSLVRFDFDSATSRMRFSTSTFAPAGEEEAEQLAPDSDDATGPEASETLEAYARRKLIAGLEFESRDVATTTLGYRRAAAKKPRRRR